MRLSGVVALFCLCLAGCERTHVIGSHCGPGTDAPVCEASCPFDTGCETATFAVLLARSGPELVPRRVDVGSVSLPWVTSLMGADASPNVWLAQPSGSLAGDGSARIAPGPFTEGAPRVLAGTPYAGALVDASGADFAVEIVFRATASTALMRRSNGARGYMLGTDAVGTLHATLEDGATSLDVVSPALVPDAWHHCVLYVSRARTEADGARLDCNGRAGVAVDVRGLGAIDVDAPVAVGGELAYVAWAAGEADALRDADDAARTEASRTRFAALTGTLPYVALGTRLPAPSQRDSGAYLDLEHEGVRSLFLMGRDWPRIVCRALASGERFCGYLAEGAPVRAYDDATSASDFVASEITVSEDASPFAEDGTRMDGLVPSAANAEHVLARGRDYGGQRLAFSFFVRAGSSTRFAVRAGGFGLSEVDLAARTVSFVEDVDASLEDWGNGLFRFAYTCTPPPGNVTHAVHLRASGGASTFAGDGTTAALSIAGLQVEIGSAYPTSLAPPGNRAADRLTYVGTDGNLDPAAAMVQAELLLPSGPRITDQAIVNLSRLGTFDDQVNLFVAGGSAEITFNARALGAGAWGFENPVRVADGTIHRVRGVYAPTGLELTVDGERAFFVPAGGVTVPASLDRVDIGHSGDASGPLEGLVRYVWISRAAP